MKTLLLAAWIAPMDRSPIREGGVVWDERGILAVDQGMPLRRQHPDAAVEELGNVLLLPGLVNAHGHLELSDLRCGDRPTSFVDWIKGLLSRRMLTAEQMPAIIEQAVSSGVEQCLRFGVTRIGDISRQCHLTRPLLKSSPLGGVSYGEVQAMAQRRGALEERLALAADSTQASAQMQIGISPHAPYSIEAYGYRRCLQLAKERNLPLATHLAETADENTFLAEHGGPFRELWAFLNGWDDAVPRFEGGPIRFARSVGILDYPTLLAHVNYCDDEEMMLLARSRASVVYCPRTHAYFGHPPHRWREMLSKGINVAAGTDSCTSSPDLNLVDDLRLMHRIAPEVPVQVLWEMATIRGARAMGQEKNAGSLTPGKAADLVAFPVRGEEPLREVLEESALLPSGVWIGGKRQG